MVEQNELRNFIDKICKDAGVSEAKAKEINDALTADDFYKIDSLRFIKDNEW